MTNEQMALHIQQGNRELLYELYRRNKPLIWRYVAPFTHGLYDAEDAMQEGFFGLEKAAMAYDYDSPKSFMSYARWHIRTTVQRNLGFLRTVPCVSIHTPIGDEDGELLDVLCDPLAEPTDAPAELADVQRSVREAVDQLEPGLGEIVQRHYFKGETFTSIAESRGMTIARAASMHKTALHRLRRMKPIRGLYIESARGSLYKRSVEDVAIQRAEYARWEKLMAEYHAYHAGQ